MKDFCCAVSAELLKLKRTLALRLAVCAPLLIVLLQFGLYLARGRTMSHGMNPLTGFVQGILTFWTILLLPFYVALVAALLASIEHQGDNWKHILTLPIPQLTIYGAKWYAGICLGTPELHSIADCHLCSSISTPVHHAGLECFSPAVDNGQQRSHAKFLRCRPTFFNSHVDQPAVAQLHSRPCSRNLRSRHQYHYSTFGTNVPQSGSFVPVVSAGTRDGAREPSSFACSDVGAFGRHRGERHWMLGPVEGCATVIRLRITLIVGWRAVSSELRLWRVSG